MQMRNQRYSKIDIKHLPEPVVLKHGEYVAPANEAEEFFYGSFARAAMQNEASVFDSYDYAKIN